MSLTDFERSDFESPTWRRLRAHLLAELDSLREQNDGNLPPDKTAFLRGQIMRVKSILDLESGWVQMREGILQNPIDSQL